MATSKKNADLTKRKTAKNVEKNEKDVFSFADEIKLLIFLGVCLLLFLGNFGLAGSENTGINWISIHLRGVFGFVQYILPAFTFVMALYLYFNPRNRNLKIKVILGYILLFIIMIFINVLHGTDNMNWEIGEYFVDGMEVVFSGGAIGGVMASLLYNVMGLVGSFVVLLLSGIIIGIIITGKSFISGVQKAGKKSADSFEKSKKRINDSHNSYYVKKSRQADKQRKNLNSRRKEPEFDVKQPQVKTTSLTFEKKEKALPVSNQVLDEEMHEVFSDSKDIDENYFNFTIQREGEKKVLSGAGYDDISDDVKTTDSKDDYDKVQNPIPEFITSSSSNNKPLKQKTKKDISNKKNIEDTVIDTVPEITEVKADIKTYIRPSFDLLNENKNKTTESDSYLRDMGITLQKTLQSFGVNVTVTNVSCGPSVTRYELQPEVGVKVSKITNLADDIKLNLAVSDIRIEAPIPGKAAVGIEVPNRKASPVLIRELLESKQFQENSSPLTFVVGKDISGNIIIGDIAKMPHLLVAGSTGSGKSVCINTIIMSLLYKASPEELKLILVDPKVVELSVYNGIPHMFIPVVTDPKKAAGALNWAVVEMDERYNKMSEMGVRDLDGYNKKISMLPDSEDRPEPFSRLVIIVDELADLMMVCGNEVEAAICRLAQKARAAGIHLILATQRPSVDVITGLIKANMPSRIAFAVSSGVDSRTIIDINGAEKLLGKGDMLFYPSGYPKPVRVQGAFVDDAEVLAVVNFLTENNGVSVTDSKVQERMNAVSVAGMEGIRGNNDGYDDYFVQAAKFVIEKGKASTSMIQRVFKVGFNRASRIIDQLEEAGVIGSEEGTKPRKVLMSEEELEQFIEESV